MITLNKVGKNFEQVKAVEEISLTIKPGEIVGLLGPNGAGKTTTLRMMAGVLPPSKGSLTINNHSFLTHGQELKQKIGFLPENNPLYDELTVEEHLQFWAQLKGIPKTKLPEARSFAVDKTGIGEVYYRLIGELSKGYRQRVGLAQAILSQPEILLLDEPTEGLDPNQRRDIQALLMSLKKDRTVIVSSHVLGEISKLATRIVIIAQGKVVGDDTPTNLTKMKSGRQIVEVEIVGNEIGASLKKLPGVEAVTKTATNFYQIEANRKKDIRPELFKLAVQKKWTLLTLRQVERQLEDVFSELTEN